MMNAIFWDVTPYGSCKKIPIQNLLIFRNALFLQSGLKQVHKIKVGLKNDFSS
jgi:hypothetical protein